MSNDDKRIAGWFNQGYLLSRLSKGVARSIPSALGKLSGDRAEVTREGLETGIRDREMRELDDLRGQGEDRDIER